MEERRAARRYKLALRVEIGLAGCEPIFDTTRDVSTRGFYCKIGQGISVGTRFKFSMILAQKVTESMQGFISGQAKVVRVEESPEESLDRVGVGAVIENFGLSQAVAPNFFGEQLSPIPRSHSKATKDEKPRSYGTAPSG